jgi:hypothetical protein
MVNENTNYKAKSFKPTANENKTLCIEIYQKKIDLRDITFRVIEQN